MLSAISRAFTTPELRKKLLFTLGVIGLFRLGSIIPTPGVSTSAVRTCLAGAASNNLYGLVNLFSGGALLQLSVFALGIMPYITASIILQLLTVVIPRLETLKNEGQAGTAAITQYTRYLTIGLAVLQSTAIITLARSGSLFRGCTAHVVPERGLFRTIVMIVVMVSATSVIMWLGELITDRGIGNGMSILIFTSIAASFPSNLWQVKLEATSNGWLLFGAVIAIGLVIMAAIVFVEQSQRRIPVTYAKRMIGRRMYGGSSTYIPLKINQAGVIPVIFASSLLYIPALASNFNQTARWSVWVQRNLVRGDNPLYMLVEFLLIVFFTYFYVAITFNPKEIADNMKKYGGFIPGIRAGRPTEEYLDYVLSRITAPGSLYLALVALIPLIAIALIGAGNSFPFGGTTILIVVGVGLDTVKQIESQLQQRSYEGFLR